MTNRLLVITLALASFTGLLSQAVLIPLLPIVADDIGSTVPLLAQTVTVSFVVGALLGLFIGPVADYFGHRRVILVGAMLVILSAVGTALADGYWTVLLARLPGGVGGGMMAAITVVLASTRFPPEERRRVIGLTVAGIAAAPIIGVPGLALIGEHFGWRAAFVAMGLLGLLSGLLLRLVVRPDSMAARDPIRLRATLDAYRPLLASAMARRLQLSNHLRAIGWGAAMTYISAYLVDVHGLSLQAIGYLFFVIGIGYLLGTRLGDGRYARFSLRAVFALSTSLMGLMFGLLFVIDASLWLLFAPLVIGVTTGGIGFVSLTILISEESQEQPATAMMLRQSGFSLGLAGGGALGGLVLALGGYDLLGVTVVAFAVASALPMFSRIESPEALPIAPQPATESVTDG